MAEGATVQLPTLKLGPEAVLWQRDLERGSAEAQKDVRAKLYTLVSTGHTGGRHALVVEDLRPRW